MEVIRTVRVNKTWLANAIEDEGGMTHLAERLGVHKGTISRAMSGGIEAGPRFIAAVMTNYPVSFQDAFDIVESTAGREADRARSAAA